MHLTFDEYQKRASATTMFPLDIGELYMALKMNGESGEVADKVLKEAPASEIVMELGDVLWYVTVLAKFLDLPLRDVANYNFPPDYRCDTFQEYRESFSDCIKTATNESLSVYLSMFTGRIAETIGKAVRDGKCARNHVGITFDRDVVEALKQQLSDILISLTVFAHNLCWNLEEVASANLNKVESRRARGAVHGSGDNR